MARSVNAETLSLVKQWEGFRAEAYPDPGSRDGTPWTIGYGTTKIGGVPVKKGQTISEPEAARLLGIELTRVAAVVERLVKASLTDNQFGALVSFTYNIGDDAFTRSTLLKKLNAGDYAAVPAQMARWVHNDGNQMQGLVNRRAAEAGLWAKGAHVSSNNVDAKPSGDPVMTKENVAWGSGILATLGALFAGTGPVQWALAFVIVGAFGIGAFLFIKSRVRPS